MSEPRLTIVTDNARRAAISVFGREAPKWARIIDDPLEILAIPDGAKCFGRWFKARDPRSPSEQAWLERRLMGGVEFMSDQDWTRFFAWRDGDAEPAKPAAEPTPAAPPAPANSMLFQVWT